MSENNLTKYKYAYNKEHYSTIRITIPKDEADLIRKYAVDYGYSSLTRFIVDAIHEKIDRF